VVDQLPDPNVNHKLTKDRQTQVEHSGAFHSGIRARESCRKDRRDWKKTPFLINIRRIVSRKVSEPLSANGCDMPSDELPSSDRRVPELQRFASRL